MEPITSRTNPRVKHLVRLRSRRTRDETSTFLVEGFRELVRAADAGLEIDEVYFCPELYLGANEPALLERFVARGSHAIELGAEAFRKVAYRDRPEGLLAVAKQFATGLDVVPPPASLLLVLESIEKPGNLGTMLRTADAAGADAVIVCDPTTDPFNPNAVRASIGSLFALPLAVTTTGEAIQWCARHHITTVATSPDAETLVWNPDYRGPVAIVVGAEQVGLSDGWLGGADLLVRIPMSGSADSLNAAMAAGIMLFEVIRQRT